MKRYDLIVVGGGLAGVCASIAAARGGMRVLLCEKTNALGGAAATMLVMPFMLNSTKVEDGSIRELSRGIFEEILHEMDAFDANNTSQKRYHFDEEVLKIVLNRMCVEAGVELLFHAYLSGVKRVGKRTESVTVATVCGQVELFADYFVDATGDGTLSTLAGCPSVVGRSKDGLCQPMTLCFRMGGVDVKRFHERKHSFVNIVYQQAQQRGEILNPRENVLTFSTLHPNILHLNTTRIVKLDPTDPFAVSKAEILAREQVVEMVNFLKSLPDCGMENAYLLSTAMEIGVRESRKVVCEHMLTEDELKSCTVFEDSIATGNYEIDIHNPEGSGTSHYFFKPGEYYTIPYRSLIPVGMENLLVVGRSIGATHEAQASIRIMPITATIGEAAGHALAQCQRRGGIDTHEVDMVELHELFERVNVSYK